MRIQILDLIAKLLRIRFKIDGIPYGAAYRPALNTGEFRGPSTTADPL